MFGADRRYARPVVETRVAMDIAVNLVETYLRLTGYLTLSEFEVQTRDARGRFKTVTDIDVMAVRFPGDLYIDEPRESKKNLLIVDPVLELLDDTVDVIIGEVKQGQAQFNDGIRDHAALYAMLQRVSWLFEPTVEMGDVIAGLQREGIHLASARGGGSVRVRLVAFGRSAFDDVSTISLTHIVKTMLGFFERYEDAFRPINFKEPAPAFLRLLLKAGFEVEDIR